MANSRSSFDLYTIQLLQKSKRCSLTINFDHIEPEVIVIETKLIKVLEFIGRNMLANFSPNNMSWRLILEMSNSHYITSSQHKKI